MTEAPVNFLSGSPLNRLSWLRSCTPFLTAVLAIQETRWILFRAGEPLVQTSARAGVRNAVPRTRAAREQENPAIALARLPTTTLSCLLGPSPIFGQGPQPGQPAAGLHDDEKDGKGKREQKLEAIHRGVLEALRLHGPPIVFLGLHEPADSVMDNAMSALPSSEFDANTDPSVVVANIRGTPYFALDVSEVPSEELELVLRDAEAQAGAGASLQFLEPRMTSFGFSLFDAAVFADARSMLDWNGRNKFCPYCGSPTYSLWAGWKLGCSSLLPWKDNKGRKPCISAKGIHNFSHPRVDPVVIMIILDKTGEKCLLGRNKKFPEGFYSALAGFLEPGESFEDAVKREIWEEAGVHVWDVTYHSSQPWPYPANLMVGFYAYADPSKPVRLDLDAELINACWFTRGEVLSVLSHLNGVGLYAAARGNSNVGVNASGASAATETDALADQLNVKPKAPDGDVDKNSGKVNANVVTTPTSESQTKLGETEEKKKRTDAPQSSSSPPLLPPFRVPPATAIAGVLIQEWAEGRIGPRMGTSTGTSKSIGRSSLAAVVAEDAVRTNL